MSRHILSSLDHACDMLADVPGHILTACRQVGRVERGIMRDGPEGRETLLAAKRQVASARKRLDQFDQTIDHALEMIPTPKRKAEVHVLGAGRPLPGAMDYAPDDTPPGVA
jgi:hypothetical protein